MLRKLASCLTAAALFVGIAGTASAETASSASHAKQENYQWSRVQIVGGGFVPGIVFNPKEKDLIYARTDIGGAYRWDASSKKWVQLLDFVGMEEWNMLGVESIATDPVDPNRVYVASGTYTNDWTDSNGVILRSANKGRTWKRTELPFKLGGNMPARSMGERLAIDPNDHRILYLGARSGNGLWRSEDFGATWHKVDSFTATGNVKDDYGDTVGVAWITFDPTTGGSGRKSQTIYVGVADTEHSVYRSLDGGATWEPVPGQPAQGFLPNHGVLSKNGMLYVSYAQEVGPYNGGQGSVWKYDTKTGVWADISPTGAGNTDSPYGGLSVDAQHPDTLVVATMNKWYPDEVIYRSTDGGKTWKPFWTMDSSTGWPPARDNAFTIDYSLAPWLDWGKKPADIAPEIAPKLGWMIASLEIDPFNSDRMMYGTGATVYGTDNLTSFDTGGKVNISVMANGIEETSVLGLVSPPSGAPLLSALGDIGGFRHADLTKAPNMITNPYIGTSTDLDYADLNPNLVVRVGNTNGVDAGMGVSQDNGQTWTPARNPWTTLPLTGDNKDQPDSRDQTNGGWVAVGADGSAIVWSPGSTSDAAPRHVSYSKDLGQTWAASEGIPDGAMVSADRVDPNRFYGFANGTFYVSTDGGRTFAATAATGLPAKLTGKFKAIPGVAGDIWLAGAADNTDQQSAFGLYHSTDAGRSFKRLDSIQEAATIGFGKAAPGKTYVALYTYAKINGKFGIYRSDDAGKTWVRINDDEHQFGAANRTITGDPRVYGRVYVGTNGLGIVQGDLRKGKP
jgi:xyloglucan-specific exo-beta-1,4-glucanase